MSQITIYDIVENIGDIKECYVDFIRVSTNINMNYNSDNLSDNDRICKDKAINDCRYTLDLCMRYITKTIDYHSLLQDTGNNQNYIMQTIKEKLNIYYYLYLIKKKWVISHIDILKDGIDDLNILRKYCYDDTKLSIDILLTRCKEINNDFNPYNVRMEDLLDSIKLLSSKLLIYV